MITKEDLYKISDNYFDTSCDVSLPGMTRTFKQLMELSKELLKERDAYREVAITSHVDICREWKDLEMPIDKWVDAEAQKIMAGKVGEI